MQCLRSARVVGWRDAPPRTLRLTIGSARTIERLRTVVVAPRVDGARAGRATSQAPARPVTGHTRRASPLAPHLVAPLASPAVHRRTELRSVTHHLAHDHRVDRSIVERIGQRREPERSVRAPAPAPPPAPPLQPSTPAPPMVVLHRPDAAGKRPAHPDERAPAASTDGISEAAVRPPAPSERATWTDAAIDDVADRVLRLMDRRARA